MKVTEQTCYMIFLMAEKCVALFLTALPSSFFPNQKKHLLAKCDRLVAHARRRHGGPSEKTI
jgi:hypothetical protein